ncbi:MAG TPA: hypothetical protein VJV78_29680 [Polyangiales bacterium]|nr:hypothetical protein [Polyangiales bacterium]
MTKQFDGQRRLRPPSNAKRACSDRGELYFWLIAPDICATYAHGAMTRNMSQLFLNQLEPVYATGVTIYGFHDWLDMASYDSMCRVDLTAWVLRHRKQTVAHIAATSRLVAMGVSVANLTLGNLFHVHDSQDGLEHALAETLSSRQ